MHFLSKPRAALLCFISLALHITPALSADLGQYGATFAIAEQDGETQLKSAVQQKLANGGQERLVSDAQRRTVQYYTDLPPLKNITAAKESKVRLVDLTIRTPQNVVDEKGKVIVPAGTPINPLAVRPLTKKVFFIDARDPRQLDLVKQRASDRDKVILTAGNLFKTQDYLKREVFIDQNPIGVMATRMKVTHAPSIASQQGTNLRIEEIAP